jgi:hypothetical protein
MKRQKPSAPPTPSTHPTPVPLKPRRALFLWLLGGYVAWLGVLLLLYRLTVHSG